MSDLDFVIAYVTNAQEAARLYGQLLGSKPVEASPNWAMFVQPNGVRIGLWARHEVEPPVTGTGGVELCFAVKDAAAVASSLDQWKALGLKIIQQPTTMDFGLTFTAEDPDGNRLRLFAPSRRD